MAKLLVHESAGAREFEIVDLEVHMGRELDNTLRLPDPSISRHHCVLRKVSEGYEIQDLQSSNGVLVNGNRVQSSPLRDGDRITLGQVQMTFQDPRPEVSSATTPVSVQVPQGTVRMSADELAAIHSGKAPEEAAPQPLSQDQIVTGQVASQAPPPVPPVAPPPALLPALPPPAASTSSLLPPIPDDAIPTGERGDFVSRLVATLIDYSPLLVLQFLSLLLVPSTLGARGMGAGLGAIAALGCLSFLLLAAYLLLVPWCWITYGATPGKKLMKLRVVPEGNPTGRLDVGMAALRMIGYLVNGLIAWVITLPFTAMFVLGAMATGGLGGNLILMRIINFGASILPYLLILFTAERKGLHDMISKTMVIKVDR
ncbi:MAG: FHA domain-containing protein [Holophagaceae bacterium]|nr:FHA domain-containing protein [Holophagaceae bacterium]